MAEKEEEAISENPRSLPSLKLPRSQRLDAVIRAGENKELLSSHDLPSASGETDKGETPTTRERPPLGGKMVFGLVLFLAVTLLCGAASGVINTFLFVFLDTLPQGDSGLIQGISVTVTTLFEIPIFYFSSALLDRISVEWLVSASLLGYVLRY